MDDGIGMGMGMGKGKGERRGAKKRSQEAKTIHFFNPPLIKHQVLLTRRLKPNVVPCGVTACYNSLLDFFLLHCTLYRMPSLGSALDRLGPVDTRSREPLVLNIPVKNVHGDVDDVIGTEWEPGYIPNQLGLQFL